jgi:hypothetical protein
MVERELSEQVKQAAFTMGFISQLDTRSRAQGDFLKASCPYCFAFGELENLFREGTEAADDLMDNRS